MNPLAVGIFHLLNVITLNIFVSILPTKCSEAIDREANVQSQRMAFTSSDLIFAVTPPPNDCP
jgi:hypothetical protein